MAAIEEIQSKASEEEENDQLSLTKDINDAQREEFRDAFKLFDKDGNGVISVDEIYTVFKDLGFKKYSRKDIYRMVEAVDLDGNHSIDLDEFIVLLRKQTAGNYKKMSYLDELEQVFKVFDGDGSGAIDAHELSSIMNALGENLSTKDVEFLIKSIDINSDGQIDFKEFKKMMQIKPIKEEGSTLSEK